MKIFRMDPHMHCYYSRVTDNKLMSAFFVNESYDSPVQVYKTAKARGMDAVTITDHNVITGCLKLKEKYDDVFISEEICTFFPEDNFRMHVVALDIDEKIHDEIQRLRFNVYDLVRYFRNEGIIHYLAHPAWGPSRPPERPHFEKFMVLFDHWEFLNGSRSWKNHDFVKALAASYTPELGQRLADKHGLPEPKHTRIIGTGGSDAHTRRNVATSHSFVPGATNYKEFLKGLWDGNIQYEGQIQSILPFSHSVYDIVGKHYSYGQKIIVGFLKDKYTKSWARMYIKAVAKFSKKAAKDSYSDERLCHDIDTFVADTIKDLFKNMGKRRGLDMVQQGLVPLINAALVAGPFLSVTGHKFKLRRGFPKPDDFFPALYPGRKTKVALVADNVLEKHGVSTRALEIIRNSLGKQHELVPITCSDQNSETFRTIRPYHRLEIPLYKGQYVFVPSITQTILTLEREDVDLVHIMTPGTMGLFAMIAAKIARIPVIGSYHTDFTDYIRHYHNSKFWPTLFTKLQSLFYNQCDMVLCLSNHSRQFLIDSGIAPEKIHLMRTGIDHDRFNDSAANLTLRQSINPENKFLILFAGRLEREKNIGVLMEAFEKIYQANPGTMLAIAGSGNLREEIEKLHLPKYPAGTIKFLDWVSHKDMPAVYASADLFLFPSTTETFGNVILEAQSCSLPAIVANKGAASEIIEHEKSGFVCAANNPQAYAEAAIKIINDPTLHQSMRQGAKQRSQNYSWQSAVEQLFSDYDRLLG